MKITVDSLGRLGNNLFQYFFAKILSKELCCEFNTNFKLPSYFGLEDKFVPNIRCTDILSENYISSNKIVLSLNNSEIGSNIHDIVEKIKKLNPEILLLRGYFQNYQFYKNYVEEIKNSFTIEKIKKEKTLGIHIRRGDIIGTENEIEDNWYLEMVKHFPNHEKYITTDSPHLPIIKELISKGCLLYENTPEKTIIDFSNFSDLILSQGTFSWWMGFLSSGNKYNLIPERGWNSAGSPIKLIPVELTWKNYKKINNKYELI